MPGKVTTLAEDIDSLGRTANRIADERNALLKALRDTINAVDQYGSPSGEYDQARFNAIGLLTRLR